MKQSISCYPSIWRAWMQLDLPDRTFIDVNHYPDAMEFLETNNLATYSGYKRRSGFVEYPMAVLNLPLLYQHAPQIFQEANIECF